MENFSNTSIKEFQNQKIILFGASSRGKRVLNNLLSKGFDKNLILFCDNDPKKYGKKIFGIPIINLEDLKKFPLDTNIFISSSMFNEIQTQLTNLGFTNIHYFHNLLFSDHVFEKYNSEFLEIIEKVNQECFLDDEEKYTLYSSLKATFALDGNIAELGVYKGGSAKIICELKKSKTLFLFDTFEGLPETSKNDKVQSGWLSDTSLDSVKQYLSKYDHVHFLQGIFPKTTETLNDETFCFVHLDTDLYQSTLDALSYFWPRMVSGGRIVSHDYNAPDVGGVKQAFDEFFQDFPEKIIEIADTQVMVIK
ncbi:TylF/MycF/NovP-related O-methyltransferase [Nitrosopumilus sp.]|uniref:TylF/MycF/NovP-related O-methyltransferase n=1 Tax=Nitrosopumilus sp. TaxID=2024843 RepID=UPI003D1127E6